MKVMLLAAGRGERMRPLTEELPKPLLVAGGKSLIEHHLTSLVAAGFEDIVINVAYLGKKIADTVGDGQKLDLNIKYSYEGDEPMETAGGIIHALPLLGDDPFLVVNADIWTDYPFARLQKPIENLAHLVMIDNPSHHPNGDFFLSNGKLTNDGETKFTYSGIGVYSPKFFHGVSPGKRPLLPLLKRAITNNAVSAEHYDGAWKDIGTPERLLELDHYLRNR